MPCQCRVYWASGRAKGLLTLAIEFGGTATEDNSHDEGGSPEGRLTSHGNTDGPTHSCAGYKEAGYHNFVLHSIMTSTNGTQANHKRSYLPSGPLYVDSYTNAEVIADIDCKVSTDGQSGTISNYKQAIRIPSQIASVQVTWDPERKVKKVMAYWDELSKDGKWEKYNSALGSPTASFYSDIGGTRRAVVACDLEYRINGEGHLKAKRGIISDQVVALPDVAEAISITQ
jgi:hypothetical protein